MEKTLSAHFTYQHPHGGPLITAALELPLDRPHITVVLGPSGSGKTTLLRCIAGLDRPQTGYIHCGDEIWFSAAERRSLPTQQRRCGYVFQDYALFPHLTVADNIAYSLPYHLRTASHLQPWLQRFHLEPLQHRYPHQISGGEQQRVALARSIATPLRTQLRASLHQHLIQSAQPVILVTHDEAEAQLLADQIIQL
jgi:molybdate transport system ATP-binding protein